MQYEFIHEAMKEVAYPRFFHTAPLDEFERKRLEALPQLPPSYVKVRFFRELDSSENLKETLVESVDAASTM
jgi:hypothetical protein